MKKDTKQFKKEVRAVLEGIISPALFSTEEPKPLKVGIIKDIFDLMVERNIPISRMQIRQCIKYYTRSTKYYKALIENKFRYDIEGNPCGEVSEENKQSAQLKLQARIARNKILREKRKERRKALKENTSSVLEEAK